jgi:hypothetical protein
MSIMRSDQCRTCAGSGAKPGTKPVAWSECGGSGQKQQTRSEKTMRFVHHFLSALPRPRDIHRVTVRDLPRQRLGIHSAQIRFRFPPESMRA